MEIIYKKPFLKKFDKYPKTLKQQIITAIEKIPEGDIVRLKGKNIPPLYRLRVRDYRILFEMNGVTKEQAKEAFLRAAHKLPFKTKFLERL